jgi:hypothetical protein
MPDCRHIWLALATIAAARYPNQLRARLDPAAELRLYGEVSRAEMSVEERYFDVGGFVPARG